MAEEKTYQTEDFWPVCLGAVKQKKGYSFSAVIPKKKEGWLLLYHKGKEEPCREIPFSENGTGSVRTLYLPWLDGRKYEYNFKIGTEVVQDPYACVIIGREKFGQETDYGEHQVRCGFWEKEPKEISQGPSLPYEDMILYKVHVRGYTKNPNSKVKKKGTFQGLMEKIPYWKELGINAIELMPAYDFWEVSIKERENGLVVQKTETERINFWGYAEGFYFVPKASYCAGKNPGEEFLEFITALHDAGIECIMEFYFPRQMNPLMCLEVLRYWKMRYHVDGFHLLGEGILPQLAVQDEVLKGTKLLMTQAAEVALKRGDGEDKYLAEYHMGFMEVMRRFLKSDENTLYPAVEQIRKNPPDYGVINYMVCQDGFTMMDLVSYDYRHNEENGENNQDGNSWNYSWNCGAEGPTRKQQIKTLRERQIKNAFLLMLLSQGTPMIYGGDEFGNSQMGNNNAWCQDNKTGWIDWSQQKKNEKLTQFVKAAIAFRKSHPLLHRAVPYQGMDWRCVGYPDFSYHTQRAWYCSFENTGRCIGLMYCGAYADEDKKNSDDFLYVAYNFHWEPRQLALPSLKKDGLSWYLAVDTYDTKGIGIAPGGKEILLEDQKMLTVPPRTIQVLLGK